MNDKIKSFFFLMCFVASIIIYLSFEQKTASDTTATNLETSAAEPEEIAPKNKLTYLSIQDQ